MISHRPTDIKALREKERKAAELEAVTNLTFVALAETGQIDGAAAGEHPDQFEEWDYPVGYKAGQIRRYDDDLYRCLADHVSQSDEPPGVSSTLWANI